jgi:hypothetical protein
MCATIRRYVAKSALDTNTVTAAAPRSSKVISCQ